MELSSSRGNETDKRLIIDEHLLITQPIAYDPDQAALVTQTETADLIPAPDLAAESAHSWGAYSLEYRSDLVDALIKKPGDLTQALAVRGILNRRQNIEDRRLKARREKQPGFGHYDDARSFLERRQSHGRRRSDTSSHPGQMDQPIHLI